MNKIVTGQDAAQLGLIPSIDNAGRNSARSANSGENRIRIFQGNQNNWNFSTPETTDTGTLDTLKSVGSTLVGSEKGFGEDITGAIGGNVFAKDFSALQETDQRGLSNLFSMRKEAQDQGKDTSHYDNLILNYQTLDGASITDALPALKKTNLQVLGDAAGVVLDTVTLGSSLDLIGSKGLAKVAGNAVLGGAYGATQGLKSGDTGGKLALDMALSGAFGAFIPSALQYTGEKAAQAMNASAKGLVNLAFNRSGKKLGQDIEKEVIGKVPSFAQRYLEDGQWFKSGRSAMSAWKNNIQPDLVKGFDAIASSEVGARAVNISEEMPVLTDSVKRLEAILGPENEGVKTLKTAIENQKSLTELSDRIGSVPQNIKDQIAPGQAAIPWKNALEIKRAINNTILPKGAFMDAKISSAMQELQRIAGSISGKLESVASDTNFKDLNDAYSLYKTAYDGIKNKLSNRRLAPWEKIVLGGSAGVLTPAIVAERLAQTTPVELGGAFGLNALSKATKKGTQAVTSPIGENIIRKAGAKASEEISPTQS